MIANFPIGRVRVRHEPQLPRRRNGNPPSLVLTGLYRPFGVVASILDTLHDLGLVGLIRLGEFFHALLVNVRNLRKPLGITRLPSAVRS